MRVQCTRSSPLIAFDGSVDNLSSEQIQKLIVQLQEAGLKQSEQERIDAFEKVSPSVAFVSVTVEKRFSPLGQAAEYPAGAGSGFVWDAEGHVVTNYHVIASAADGPMCMPRGGRGGDLPRKVMVKLAGMEEHVEAKIVGFEADKDLAVLKVDPDTVALRPLDISYNSNIKVGQDVLAIGNPFGLDFTLTTGIVSALGRDIQGAGGRPIKDCIQTDAAINPGNSGGPLLDSAGRLLGVNTMIYAPNGHGGNVGIGFAIPVDTVNRVVTQIIAYGQNARPSIGVSVLPDADRERYARSLGRKLEGAIVAEVVKGSPAAQLKLQPLKTQFNGILLGDMITHVNGDKITQNEQLLCAVEETMPNEPITITVMRNCDPKKVQELQITPVQRKALFKE